MHRKDSLQIHVDSTAGHVHGSAKHTTESATCWNSQQAKSNISLVVANSSSNSLNTGKLYVAFSWTESCDRPMILDPGGLDDSFAENPRLAQLVQKNTE